MAGFADGTILERGCRLAEDEDEDEVEDEVGSGGGGWKWYEYHNRLARSPWPARLDTV